jgi:ethanolamine ammonia-lyase large subunit
MSRYRIQLRHTSYEFADLKTLMARASPLRSGDQLAGVAAANMQERVAAQMILADVPLRAFLEEPLIAPETDEVSRLILETHDAAAFAPVANLSVAQFRDWLLRYETTSETLSALAPGLTPEMVAAVSKIMGNQDLILVARKCRVVTRFRNTIGLPNQLSVRLQPNHPTDSPRGIAASILDGLLMGCGDAVIGINPASDSVAAIETLVCMMAEIIENYQIPTQSCVLAHVTTQIKAIERGVPVDLVFQSVAGTEAANSSFGINLRVLEEALDAARSLKRGTVGDNVMYFETGQGSCLSANAHHGLDQQTLEARAYAVARRFEPLLVNTVVGFIGPEYLYDGKQIIRAGLEDHFCGKMLGVPMGCDVCYTNHAEADQDDMDNLLMLLGAAGCNFIMGVPGADDIMLGYQSTSFHDVHFLRQTLGLKPAPEFEAWLQSVGVSNAKGELQPTQKSLSAFTNKPSKALPLPQSSTQSLSEVETDAQLGKLLRAHTPARLALSRSGGSLGTSERLDFHMAHANARDAVHWPFDREGLIEQMDKRGWPVLSLWSDAPDRAAYLQRPDWGRRLGATFARSIRRMAAGAKGSSLRHRDCRH